MDGDQLLPVAALLVHLLDERERVGVLGSISRIASKALIASAWLENFSKNRFAMRSCNATFSADVSTTDAFLRRSEIRSGQRFIVSYCAASSSAASKLVG